MGEETVKALVEGGKASAGPPIGPALGSLGVNVGRIVSEINELTADYEGMTIPVKIKVDKDTREFEIEVGSPPTSALIRKELGIKKGAGSLEEGAVGDLSMRQLMKLAKQKKGSTLAKGQKARAKEILGTCLSMGVTVDGKDPREVQSEIEKGLYENQLE
ncbi:50S ribosomal protein L11 [candidate division MSBL1 archaeon SCGC-AAA261F19]|uniref:Large ribosomal subunit protein uL11 n=2 Tax=candidate division MSBL1 TaxID=215777 RepID=A0A133VAH1_9EURY|nr:50S ribosomal protein L11 [candidate division MSBL1 archaeon SCGC-AAA261D19]KXB03452.1 50S ribosomal protein L11 [candidate division MSBL1 archaeon SCGC-AAA261F19]